MERNEFVSLLASFGWAIPENSLLLGEVVEARQGDCSLRVDLSPKEFGCVAYVLADRKAGHLVSGIADEHQLRKILEEPKGFHTIPISR